MGSKKDEQAESDFQSEEESQCSGEIQEASSEKETSLVPTKKKKVYKLSLTQTEDFNAKLRKRGVVHISRVPPRMGPTKVKALLGEFGTVTRIYLEEEDKTARKRRQRASGSKGGGKRFVEGWIEFENKKRAKHVAASLNNTPITNHKRNVHFGDLWNLKYLSKFQWAHLTEKVAYERRVREQKLKIEMMQARKENQAYSSLVEAGKTMDRIEARRTKRNAKDSIHADDQSNKKKQKIDENGKRATRKFKQTQSVGKDDKAAKLAVLGSLI
mmetsp:Transcript_1972/g.2672  ORF Transcript_1972/g.2672 Transcript_1972/m.2672 type:complete len:271 (+) Transcript_1972:99-911(+)